MVVKNPTTSLPFGFSSREYTVHKSRMGGNNSLPVISFLTVLAVVDFSVVISGHGNPLVVIGGFLCAFVTGFRLSEYLAQRDK